jgi:hypothetical protein
MPSVFSGASSGSALTAVGVWVKTTDEILAKAVRKAQSDSGARY